MKLRKNYDQNVTIKRSTRARTKTVPAGRKKDPVQ